MKEKILLDYSEPNCILKLRDIIYNHIITPYNNNRPIVVICIGTDRSTGDSLGPLVGDKLKFFSRDNLYIYGNLQDPIHAKNLHQLLKKISKNFKDPYIIAIDSCLGSIQHIGKICIEEKPLSPGSAMNKKLPEIGDLSIKGIVNICGTLEFVVLQNTRLNTVMKLADIISQGIYHAMIKTMGGKHTLSRNMYKTN